MKVNKDTPDVYGYTRRQYSIMYISELQCSNWKENAYFRLVNAYNISITAGIFWSMCCNNSYDALFHLHWEYYVKNRPVVIDIYRLQFSRSYGIGARRALCPTYVIGVDGWTKDTCAHLEQLSLLSASVPLGDPRMNMIP